jgi:hypothetical protein
MIRTSKLGLLAGAVFFCCLAIVPSAKADPITFSNVTALQDGGATQVNLLSNPGATLFGSEITFLVDINGTLAPGSSTVLQITHTIDGGPPIIQTFAIPVFPGVDPPYTQVFSVTIPNLTFTGRLVTLTVSIPEGDSRTFTFFVAEPVPEPGSIILLSLGGIGLWSRLRRSRARTQPRDPGRQS